MSTIETWEILFQAFPIVVCNMSLWYIDVIIIKPGNKGVYRFNVDNNNNNLTRQLRSNQI